MGSTSCTEREDSVSMRVDLSRDPSNKSGDQPSIARRSQLPLQYQRPTAKKR